MIPESMKEWTTMMLSFFAIIALHFFWSRHSSADLHVPNGLIGGSYEMQRVKNDFIRGFDLSDRTVNYRKIVNNKPFVPAMPRNGMGTVVPGKGAIKQLKKPAPKVAAKNKAESTPDDLPENQAAPETGDVNAGGALPVAADAGVAPPSPFSNVAPPLYAKKTRKTAPAEQLTESQWINVLMTNPTSVEIASFIAAKKTLGSTAYYGVLTYMLTNNSTSVQQTAEKIITLDVSPSTFEYVSNLPPNVRSAAGVSAFATATVQSYGSSPSMFSILVQVLLSQDPASIINVENLITADYKKVSQTANVNTKNTQVTAFSVSQFTVFKKPLVSLEANSNAQVSQLAKTLVSQIWPNGTLQANLVQPSENRVQQ